MILSAISLSWPFLLFSRFFVGVFIGGLSVSMFILANELILPNQRMFLCACVNWGTGRLALSLMGLAFPDWRSATFAAAIAVLPAFIFVLFIVPESPTWLFNKNRMNKMIGSEKKMASAAGVPFIKSEPKSSPSSIRGPSFSHLIHEKALMRRLFVLWTLWFTAAICSYSIDLNSSSIISGNLYLNQCLLSIIIIVSKLFLLYFDTNSPNFSRRALHQLSQSMVILSFLTLSIMILRNYQGVLILVANMVGSIFNEFTWDACFLCATESVPTTLRSSTIASCSVFAKIGALFVPLLIFLNTFWAPSAYLAVVLLGSINLLNSYFGLIETKGIDLDMVQVDSRKVVHDLEL